MCLRFLSFALHADIDNFAEGMEQHDDITMLTLRFSAPESAAEQTKRLPENHSEKTSIILDADISQTRELALLIREKLQNTGCPLVIQNQIELSAEEVFVNITRYAYPDSSGSCEITVTANEQEITLLFKDSGIRFNPLEEEEPDINSLLTKDKRGGLGIVIVKRVMDVVEYNYQNGMNHLFLKKIF